MSVSSILDPTPEAGVSTKSPGRDMSVGARARTAFLTELVRTVVAFAVPFLQFVEILYKSFQGLERLIDTPFIACLRVDAEA